MKKIIILFLIMTFSLTCFFFKNENKNINVKKIKESKDIIQNHEVPNGTLEISLDFKRSTTQASNQFAIWIEDDKKQMVKTLFVTDFTANGGYKFRKDSIPKWVECAKLDQLNENQIDALSSATPSTGTYSYTWDGTDDNGNKVSNGIYTINIEATLYWSSRVFYQGKVEIGSMENKIIDLEAVYSEDAVQNRNMLTNVTAIYEVE